jgi:branched-chain amino acid transport system substrate-binding protein
LLVGALALTAGCGGRSPGVPIWLGHVATLSGPEREPGEAAARGIRLAVEDINKDLDAGVGRPFKVVHSDTRGRLEAFEAEAVRLATVNRVSFLLGGSTAEEVERLDRARLPVLTPLGFRGRGLSDAVYFLGAPHGAQAKALATLAVDDLKADSLLLVEDERGEALGEIIDAFKRELSLVKKDAKAPAVRVLRFGKTVLAGGVGAKVAEELKQKPVRAIVIAGRPEDLRELGPVAVPVLFAGGDVGAKTVRSHRPAGMVLYFVTAFMPDAEMPRAAEFAKRYQAAFGEEADVNAAVAYDGLKLLYEAVCRSKDSLTAARVREELGKLKDVPGLTGTVSFTAERQLRRPLFVVRADNDGVKTVKRLATD